MRDLPNGTAFSGLHVLWPAAWPSSLPRVRIGARCVRSKHPSSILCIHGCRNFGPFAISSTQSTCFVIRGQIVFCSITANLLERLRALLLGVFKLSHPA